MTISCRGPYGGASIKDSFYMESLEPSLIRASSRQKDNFDFVRSACARDGNELEMASYSLKDHPEIVKVAVSSHPEAMQYASMRLRSDLEFIKSCLDLGDLGFLCYVDQKFLSDDKLSLELLGLNPAAFAWLDPVLQTNRSFIIQACQDNLGLFDYLPKELVSEYAFYNELCFSHEKLHIQAYEFVQDKLSLLLGSCDFSIHSLTRLDPSLWDNAVFVTEIVKREPHFFKMASSELQLNESFVQFLISSANAGVYPYLDESFQKDLTIALKVVTHKPHLYNFMSDEMKKHRLVALRALSQRGSIYRFLPQELKLDPEVSAQACVCDPEVFIAVPYSVTLKPLFWAILLHVSTQAAKAMDPSLRDNKQFWYELIKLDDSLFHLAPYHFKKEISLSLRLE